MNELQQVEFDLFKRFVEICEKLELNYFMLEGSALGAARHKGFIPWDDDLDVGMYREDYEKFMNLAPAMLPEGLFLQSYKSDSEFPLIFAKLRNSNTTYIEKRLKKYNINHGCYIDIFPLDGYSSNILTQKMIELHKKNHYIKRNCGEKMERTRKGYVYAWILCKLGYHNRTTKTMEQIETYLSGFPVKGSSIICNHGSPYGKKDYISAAVYGKGSDAVFEGMTVRVPENVDGYLTSLYGDWRTPPPPEKRIGRHGYEICDTEKPYTYYTNQEQKK